MHHCQAVQRNSKANAVTEQLEYFGRLAIAVERQLVLSSDGVQLAQASQGSRLPASIAGVLPEFQCRFIGGQRIGNLGEIRVGVAKIE
jgi:hypothetical protein